MRIAIIGLGCSGTLVLRAIADQLFAGDSVEILLFESRNEIAAGIPYGASSNDRCFMLNMQASLLSANIAHPEEFIEWLSENTSDTAAGTDYVPRTYMGEYLASVLRSSLGKLSQLNISYEIVRDEIGDMQVRGNEYLLFGTTQVYTSDRVILAPGHMKKRGLASGERTYIPNPYHSLQKVRDIPKNACVGILGSKLTAVDMALLLNELGIRRISMFSGSGRLPLVRGVPFPEDRLPIVPRPPTSSLRSFLKTIREQVDSARVIPEYEGFLSLKDERVRLHHELQQASGPRFWHALLDETKYFIDDFWRDLSPRSKRIFLRKYQGLWMSYRHPMPPRNARKIAAMLDDGSLVINSGYNGSFSRSGEGWTTKVRDGTNVTVDYLIDASGTPSDVREIDSPLITNLLRNRIVTSCEFGGIECEPATHRIRPLSNVYVIGQLSRGRVFYVSAVERLAVHASIIATDLIRSLSIASEKRLEETTA